MFSSFLDILNKYFDKRFIFAAFFPSLVFGGASVVLYLALQGPKATLERWDTEPAAWRVLLTVAFFVAVTFVSYLLEAFSVGISSLYEGRWLLGWRRSFHVKYYADLGAWVDGLNETVDELRARARILTPGGKESDEAYNQRYGAWAWEERKKPYDFTARLKKLDLFPRLPGRRPSPDRNHADHRSPWHCAASLTQWSQNPAGLAEADRNPLGQCCESLASLIETESRRNERELLLYYPPSPAAIVPTRFGNILRAAEYYPFTRYRMDGSALWPRLRLVLTEPLAGALQDAKAKVDLLLNLASLAIVFTLGWEIYLATQQRWVAFSLASLGWILVFLAHRAATASLIPYTELIRTAYDTHRLDLMAKLTSRKPTSFKQEGDLWEALAGLYWRNYEPPTDLYYEPPKKESPSLPWWKWLLDKAKTAGKGGAK
jgi:hypothetical protein